MNLKKDRPEATVMEITPAIAKEMLDSSQGNRRMRGWYVSLLAAAMKRGEWRVTSQGIGIDKNGHLRDAHHRLTACVNSGVSFQSVVVFGLREDAYQVTDTGINRTCADILGENRRVSDVLTLGSRIALATQKPTIDQMTPIIDAGLGQCARALIEFCGASRKYFSSAPMKLAACITIMNGGDADYVLGQYRAMCCLDFEAMSRASQALIRQTDSGKAKIIGYKEPIARGMRVFDKDRSEISRIQASEADIESAHSLVRSVLLNSVERSAS